MMGDDFDCLIPHAKQFLLAGCDIILVTLIANNGSSPRPVGSQMVVSSDGRYHGYLTGGCAENVVVDEALSVLASGQNRFLRLGEGSPYIDVQLPCGSGIDLYFDIHIDFAVIDELANAIEHRVPVALEIDYTHYQARCMYQDDIIQPQGSFRRWYWPLRQLIVIGKGPYVSALAKIASASSMVVQVLAADPDNFKELQILGVHAEQLRAHTLGSNVLIDQYTAVVLLFHEHERELSLLKACLDSPCFYIGALGSRKTHEQRLNQLLLAGISPQPKRIRGPVGLDIGARSPTEIAVSIVAEIIQIYQANHRSLLIFNSAGVSDD